mmetsp:Transcript_20227/g.48637  ORF Transcript_20227/g.48637 Transcript_20227/m.48637 type:complete len:678 (-) Transcript_20227:164-2197(-)|eukprot:CAMPEP_0181099120 /NCGR_PEP_ID=MMETSP1071-20121207/12491_1 /TAXON_ID=35127 /ORGANISM="Thalassiosira sp., Strain NH16" /LENGTH=677 /DNA_ID=CAMNT_0023181763 /DNA_START=92 /DNA_END=2125 /DNA_ORIENTATION=+
METLKRSRFLCPTNEIRFVLPSSSSCSHPRPSSSLLLKEGGDSDKRKHDADVNSGTAFGRSNNNNNNSTNDAVRFFFQWQKTQLLRSEEEGGGGGSPRRPPVSSKRRRKSRKKNAVLEKEKKSAPPREEEDITATTWWKQEPERHAKKRRKDKNNVVGSSQKRRDEIPSPATNTNNKEKEKDSFSQATDKEVSSNGKKSRARHDENLEQELIRNEESRSSNGNTSLVRSVEDALKDKAGRRPRANSTDRELNLPQHGLCDERIVLRTHKWDTRRLLCGAGRDHSPRSQNKAAPVVPRGLVNLGNTCFLNATLQCLAYTPPFCQSIAALPTSCYEEAGAASKGGSTSMTHGQRITMFLRKLLRLVHGIQHAPKKGGDNNHHQVPKTTPIAPRGIHKAITSRKINGHNFRPGRQEDAHELLVHLLDAMQEGELAAAGIDPNRSGWRDRLPIPRLDETTFVHRIFGGYFRSQLGCNKCGYKSNTYDPFLDIALEVSKSHITSLMSAFKEFTRRETLDSDNRWKCAGCKKRVRPTKHLSVFRPPLSLCIHLKRFGFETASFGGGHHHHGGWGSYGHRNNKGFGGGGSKISKKIDFPARLSLPLSDGRTCQYLLTGVIIHVGNSATTGHYTSFVRRPGVGGGGSHDKQQWCHMDDSYAEMVSEQTVLKQRKQVYVLFYTKQI